MDNVHRFKKNTDLDSFIKKNYDHYHQTTTFFVANFPFKKVKSTSPKYCCYMLMKIYSLFCLFNSHNMKCLEKHQHNLEKQSLGENIFSKTTEIIRKNTFIINGTFSYMLFLKSEVTSHCFPDTRGPKVYFLINKYLVTIQITSNSPIKLIKNIRILIYVTKYKQLQYSLNIKTYL